MMCMVNGFLVFPTDSYGFVPAIKSIRFYILLLICLMASLVSLIVALQLQSFLIF